MTKPRILVFGNCQGSWVAKKLRLHPAVSGRWEVIHLANFGDISPEHPIYQPDFFRSCSHVFWQAHARFKFPEFHGRIPAGCHHTRYPVLHLQLLWPFSATDPRNAPTKERPFGRYPYGDRLLMKLMQEGVAPENLTRAYVEADIGQMVNLDRFSEISWAELRANDAQSDIATVPFIEKGLRHQRLFSTVNHPAMPLLDHICGSILNVLLGSPTAEALTTGREEVRLGHIDVPVHPQVAKHFGLEWVTPDTKWRSGDRFLSLDEYVRAYAEVE